MAHAIPYIYSKDIEHAVNYYVRIFGPELVSFKRTSYSDNPHKTLKCVINFAGTTIYAADGYISYPKERSIAINLEFEHMEIPLAMKVSSIMENCGEFEIVDNFTLKEYNKYSGTYKDKFGITWIISAFNE